MSYAGRCAFFPPWDGNGGRRAFLSTRLAMIVAESSARSNLFLPVRGISRRGGIFIYGD